MQLWNFSDNMAGKIWWINYCSWNFWSVSLYGVFTPPTRQFCLVSTQFPWVLSRLDPVSTSQLIACSHRQRGQDKTLLCCPRRRCKHTISVSLLMQVLFTEFFHRIHRRQHATDNAGMSKHRLSPYYAYYHNWDTLNFTVSDSSSDERCFLIESANSATVDATGREHIPIINNSIRKTFF